ncbi:MAG: sulfatase-like hydrolase/transferase [Planctomycetes bacterium]|nr:sulfatase-like hydrolase/transferase [Planctomycetota bacterium]
MRFTPFESLLIAFRVTFILLMNLSVQPVFAQDRGQSNFVIILADDQGWNALSTPADPEIPGSGSSYYRTPNLDKLVSQGVCFSRAYSPSATCGPSRHSIQFGRSPSSLGLFASPKWGKIAFTGKESDSMVVTLKKACPEYVTAHLGKWHLGYAKDPGTLGYDIHDGSTGNAEGNSEDPNDPKSIFDLSERANAFI